MNEDKTIKIGDRVQYTNIGYWSFLQIKENRHISLNEWTKLYHANEEAMDIAISERKGTIVDVYMHKDRQVGWFVRWDNGILADEIETICYFDELQSVEEVEQVEEVEEVEEVEQVEEMIYYTIQKGYEIFGTGTTAEESWADAKEWIDKDSPLQSLSVDDLPTYASAADGDFCIVEREEYEEGDR